jgi:hypothetical protein
VTRKSLYQKLQNWLDPASKAKAAAATGTAGGVIAPVLSEYLMELQKRQHNLAVDSRPPALLRSALVLRQVCLQVPQGALTAADEKSIELLARIFDFILNEQTIPSDIRVLIGRLQIPLLKVALIDKDFFFNEQHPARRVLETLTRFGLSMDPKGGSDDPLYELIEHLVERVQVEFFQQIELFSELLAGLEGFIAEVAKMLQSALTEPIAESLRHEKFQLAREAAEIDVASRVETGEVAGFVETFLETQWLAVLESAHVNADRRPEALEHARKAMDDLICSLKPSSTLEARKDLVGKLPAILSRLDGWLDVIGSNHEERALFFSRLAERHAAIVRAPLELSSRRQVEMAVNVAQKASNRQMRGRARKMKRKKLDQFVKQVDAIDCGACLEFVGENESKRRLSLAWISPRRTRFILASRRGEEVFALTTDELAQAFRGRNAAIVPITSVVDCALASAFDQIGLT